jgi:hypothetical protein
MSPVQVSLTLKESQYRGYNKWECTINGEVRLVTLQRVTYYVADFDAVMLTFKKSEVKEVLIAASFASFE